MADYINDNEVPVFLINGFLEAGKTAFIKYTMGEEYFQIDGRTLLIVCEEGEVEYKTEELKEFNTVMVVAEEEAEFTRSWLEGLAERYKPERVIIEFNGMWNMDRVELPEDWVLYQQVTIMDGTTLPQYLANMKSLMGPMLRNSELCIVNRCDGRSEEELIRLAASGGIKVYGLSEYYVERKNEKPESVILLGYANMEEEKIKEAAAVLKKVWLA